MKSLYERALGGRDKSSLMSNKDVSVRWINKFFTMYPAAVDQSKEFYENKCDAISLLFQKMLVSQFDIHNATIKRGRNMNYNNVAWITDPTDSIKKNIANHKSGTSHVVVDVAGNVFDLSSKQFHPGNYSMYGLEEFHKRWVDVSLLDISHYNSSLRADLESSLHSIKRKELS